MQGRIERRRPVEDRVDVSGAGPRRPFLRSLRSGRTRRFQSPSSARFVDDVPAQLGDPIPDVVRGDEVLRGPGSGPLLGKGNDLAGGFGGHGEGSSSG